MSKWLKNTLVLVIIGLLLSLLTGILLKPTHSVIASTVGTTTQLAETTPFLKSTQALAVACQNLPPGSEPCRIRVPYTKSNRPKGQAHCDCPYDRANDGNLCDNRSAYARPKGKEPVCYVGETSARQKWYFNKQTSFVDESRTGR